VIPCETRRKTRLQDHGLVLLAMSFKKFQVSCFQKLSETLQSPISNRQASKDLILKMTLRALVGFAMPTAIESAASIGDKDNDEDDVSDDGDVEDQGATKKRKVLDVLEIDMFQPDDIFLMDGGGGM